MLFLNLKKMLYQKKILKKVNLDLTVKMIIY